MGMIISHVCGKESVSRSEARRIVHKYVCEGKCNWYQTKSRKVGVHRLSLTGDSQNSMSGAS
ncbi:MAG: hypothetical protein ACE5NN_05535 [Candidatus Bathyarchaeia archaeon]